MISITATSKFVPLDRFEQGHLDFRDVSRAISKNCRYNGACKLFYSVAEHSMILADTFDEPELKMYALLHDASEAYLGDVCEPFKSSLSVRHSGIEEGIHPFEMRIQGTIFEVLGLSRCLPHEVQCRDKAMLEWEMRQMFDGPFPDWLLDKWKKWERVLSTIPFKGNIEGLDHEEGERRYLKMMGTTYRALVEVRNEDTVVEITEEKEKSMESGAYKIISDGQV
jgi:hypothetical protein